MIGAVFISRQGMPAAEGGNIRRGQRGHGKGTKEAPADFRVHFLRIFRGALSKGSGWLPALVNRKNELGTIYRRPGTIYKKPGTIYKRLGTICKRPGTRNEMPGTF